MFPLIFATISINIWPILLAHDLQSVEGGVQNSLASQPRVRDDALRQTLHRHGQRQQGAESLQKKNCTGWIAEPLGCLDDPGSKSECGGFSIFWLCVFFKDISNDKQLHMYIYTHMYTYLHKKFLIVPLKILWNMMNFIPSFIQFGWNVVRRCQESQLLGHRRTSLHPWPGILEDGGS